MPLKVKITNPLATPPKVSHPGEDLGYDVYAIRVQHQPVNLDGTPATYNPPKNGMPVRLDLNGGVIHPIRIEQGKPTLVSTGISAHFVKEDGKNYGLLIRDRSSLAAKGIFVTAGVVDAGYRGEIKVILNLSTGSYQDIWPGDKIAQLIPIEVLADSTEVVNSLEDSERKEDGFGSTGA